MLQKPDKVECSYSIMFFFTRSLSSLQFFRLPGPSGEKSGFLTFICVLTVTAVLTACTGSNKYTANYYQGGKPKRQAEYHTVVRGETMYSIAWQYGLDYRKLAAWNRVKAPYTIYPAQRLRVKPYARTGQGKAVKRKAHRTTKQPPARTVQPVRRQAAKSTSSPRPAKKPSQSGNVRLSWRWPSRGKLISTFSARNSSRQGIDISGRSGQPIYAAATGRVVYSGSGLRGYGELIIIKHNATYFSAYAHNKKLRVREDQRVKKGQHIADMGNTGSDRVMLHFEIRRNGIPVNPLKYLPKR